MPEIKADFKLPDTEAGLFLDHAPLTTRPRAQVARRALCALLGLAAAGNLLWPHLNPTAPEQGATASSLEWTACGDRFLCTSITAPLDHRNLSDPRMVSIAVVKMAADPPPGKKRLGSIYINPGGPGGSGSKYVYDAGPAFQKLSGGQYDIIGWDPRGINLTLPSVSCFDTALDEYQFAITAPTHLDIPVNFTSVPQHSISAPNPHGVADHLERQVQLAGASFASLYAKCAAKSGDALAYVGTEAVVRDLDLISRRIDGEDAKINFWGLSYGTIVGQYLTSIVPPGRLGRVLLDGVVDWEPWTTHHIEDSSMLADDDRVLEAFADACATAGEACALSHLGSRASILGAIDSVVDQLYHSPASVPYVSGAPGLVARAWHARLLVFRSAYSIKSFPFFADAFADALAGNYSRIVSFAMPRLDGTWADAARRGDSTRESTTAIRCADQPPYSAQDPAPDAKTIASRILRTLGTRSRRVGEQMYDLGWCHLWPASKSRYEGGFELEPGTLETPVLILTQKFDPVTPLASAKKAMINYGSNARLVEQNGTGHCAVGQAALCTARIMRDYWLHGSLPTSEHTYCEVDELPFKPYEPQVAAVATEDRDLLVAWSALGEVHRSG